MSKPYYFKEQNALFFCESRRQSNSVWRKFVVTVAGMLVTCVSFAQTLNNFHGTVTQYVNQNLTLTGNTEITITHATNPLPGSTLNMVSDNVWLYFPEVIPSVFISQHLSHLRVNGATAVPDDNMRVDQYLEGTMVISRPANFNALQIFSGASQSGTSLQLQPYTYYRSVELGALNNNVESFILKRGYMATFAQDDMGSGFSRVYIADNADVVVNLPARLTNEVSFIRVFPWRWTAKKGWTSGHDAAAALECRWQYNWDNADTSSYDIEYVPMRHNRWWNSYDNINNKIKSTHALGFNEPDRTDQANMTVQDALAQWPELLKSGLRLGSPVPSDGGLPWLYEFIDNCDALNYRVDFVAVHWYQGGQTALQFYNWLKAVYNRTKRPLWVTEWNNGANWTCCTPTYEDQAQRIAEFVNMLDTASFVERYSLYEWVGDTRKMFYTSPTSLTPAGVNYRDNVSPMAYNSSRAYNPAYFNNYGIQAGSTYQIIARHSGKVIDANGSANLSAVRQMPYTSAANQQWKVTHVGNGYYKITSLDGGRALDHSVSGSSVILYDYWGGTNQQWSFVPVTGGYFNIVNRSTGKVLDVSGGPSATADNRPVLAWTSNGQTNQQWTMTPVSSAARMAIHDDDMTEDPETEQSTHVSPNPVERFLTVNVEGAVGDLSIYSANGQMMKRSRHFKGNEVDVSDLLAGVYVIQIFNGQRFVNERFVKR